MVARTLTQPAVPTTFGAKAAGWLNGVVDAYQQVAPLATPVQIGGAGVTLAAERNWRVCLGNAGNPAKVSAHLARPPQPPLACTLQRPGIPPERQ